MQANLKRNVNIESCASKSDPPSLMKLSETLTVGDLQEIDYHCERTLQRVVILDDSAPLAQR
jgi:hypothetical protein